MPPMAIRAEALTKRYGGVAALDHLDLEVSPGEVVGFLGPNGAGKTTTIRLLLGLIRPTGGRSEIFGLDCERQSVEAHRRLAFVAGEANLWPSLTGAETLHLLGRVQGQVDEVYRDALIERFELDPSKKVRAYSKGNRQKVILIAALMVRPDLLVLDERGIALDRRGERKLENTFFREDFRRAAFYEMGDIEHVDPHGDYYRHLMNSVDAAAIRAANFRVLIDYDYSQASTVLPGILDDLGVTAIAHVMSEKDVQAVLKHPRTMVGTDGLPTRAGKPHPRTYGTYPRVLQHYVGELGLLTLEEAVHRMTGMVARKLGMRDRGVLAPGAAADVVVFDPRAIKDHATYADPRRSPEGVAHVFVNGAWTVRDGKHTGARAGTVLSKAPPPGP